MTGRPKFEQFKGDILLSLIVSDLLLEQGVKRSEVQEVLR